MAVSEHIVSYIKSTPALLQASHATKLQENPGFSLVLGLGYNEAQVHPRSCTSAPPQPEDRHPPPPPPSSFASHGTTFNGMFLEHPKSSNSSIGRTPLDGPTPLDAAAAAAAQPSRPTTRLFRSSLLTSMRFLARRSAISSTCTLASCSMKFVVSPAATPPGPSS